MLTNILLALVLFTLTRHHHQVLRRHDRAVNAWRLALELALRADPPRLSGTSSTPKPKGRPRRALR